MRITRSTKRMLNALAKEGMTYDEQFKVAVKHDINVSYRNVIWFNRQTLRAIKNGEVSLEFGAFNGRN